MYICSCTYFISTCLPARNKIITSPGLRFYIDLTNQKRFLKGPASKSQLTCTLTDQIYIPQPVILFVFLSELIASLYAMMIDLSHSSVSVALIVYFKRNNLHLTPPLTLPLAIRLKYTEKKSLNFKYFTVPYSFTSHSSEV